MEVIYFIGLEFMAANLPKMILKVYGVFYPYAAMASLAPVFVVRHSPDPRGVLVFAAGQTLQDGHQRPGQTFRSGTYLRCAPARRAICHQPATCSC